MRDRRPRKPLFVLLLGLLLAIALIAGCGGGSGGSGSDENTDPQTVLDSALGGGEPIDSGVLDLSLTIDSSAAQGGTVSASLTGPFQSSGDGNLPQIDFDAKANGDTAGAPFDIEAGLTLTSDGAYVKYAGSAYKLDDATFQLLQSSYEQSSQLQDSQKDQGSLSQFGIDPESWVTDLKNVGTEDLDGTEVVHISGTADIDKIVEDLTTVAQQTGQASQLDTGSLEQLKSSISNATIDVYASTDDSTLRKFEVKVDIADPSGAADTTSIDLSVGISDPGGDQSISAPADAKPIQDLLSQIPGGAGALGALGSLGSGSTGTGTSTPPATSSGSGSSGAASAYLDCAAKAKDAAAVDACASLLGG
jgi:hypothetical protein